MKAVLMSIQPKRCELIASGKKTVEVRKTKPKLETPFKVYIYCTIGKTPKDILYLAEYNDCEYVGDYIANGKVIGEFVCDRINEITADNLVAIYFNNPQENTCLSDLEMRRYADGKNLFLWHISDLIIYDKPRELSDFKRVCDGNCQECKYAIWQTRNPFDDPIIVDCKPITRPPQSWCYVERSESDG